MAQLQALFEQGLFFGAKAHVVQQQHLPVLQFPDRLPGQRAAHVLHPLHGRAQKPGEGLGVRTGGIEVLVFNVAPLMGQQHHPGAALHQFPHRGNASLNAVRAFQDARGFVHRLVDVYPAQRHLALYLNLIQRIDAKAHVHPPYAARGKLFPPRAVLVIS